MSTKLTVSGLNSITLGSGVATSTRTSWTRPSDWLALPSVISSDQKFAGLYAVFENDDNFCALSAIGNYTVDWGDGVTENFSTGAIAYHKYDYTSSALNGTLSSRGYKQAVIVVTPQAGQNLAEINLLRAHNQAGTNVAYCTGWLDIILSMPNCNSITISSTSAGATAPTHKILERCNILNCNNKFGISFIYCAKLQVVSLPDMSTFTGSLAYLFYDCPSLLEISPMNCGLSSNGYLAFFGCASIQSITVNTYSMTSTEGLFNRCYSLREIKGLDTRNSVIGTSMFLNCTSLRTIPNINTSSMTNMTQMFAGCSSLEYIPFIDTSKATNMSQMFLNCQSLQGVPNFVTGNCTNMAQMFNGCLSLEKIPTINTAAVSNTWSMFADCTALREIPTLSMNLVSNAAVMFRNCSGVTSIPITNTASITNANQMFSGCFSLRTIPNISFNTITSSAGFLNAFANCRSVSKINATGFNYTFSISNMNMSNTQLNSFFTSLPSVTGQTITITGNPGAATANATIATNKGWTVTN